MSDFPLGTMACISEILAMESDTESILANFIISSFKTSALFTTFFSSSSTSSFSFSSLSLSLLSSFCFLLSFCFSSYSGTINLNSQMAPSAFSSSLLNSKVISVLLLLSWTFDNELKGISNQFLLSLLKLILFSERE